MTTATREPYRRRTPYRRSGGAQEIAVLHKFAVGQNVHLSLDIQRDAGAGSYKVSRLMPISGTDGMNPRYRIKSEAETYERVAAECDLRLSDGLPMLLPHRQDSPMLPE